MGGGHLEKVQSRIDYIDLLRAAGIILMIMGHIGFGDLFAKWIHIFHMPMFFIISGYFYRDQKIGLVLKKRAKTLLIPYLFFGIMHILINSILTGNFSIHDLYLLFWDNTEGAGIPIAGALWFLTASFFAEILFRAVQKISKSDTVTTLAAAALSLAGMACGSFLPFHLPLALDAGMVGAGLFQVGKLLKDRGQYLLKMKMAVSCLGIVLFSLLGLINGYVNLRTGSYGIWPLFWINAVFITVSLWNFFRCVFEWAERSSDRSIKIFFEFVRGIGRDSIVYLCLNQLSIKIANVLVDKLPLQGGKIILLIRLMLILFITMLELYAAQKLIMGSRLKKVVGK